MSSMPLDICVSLGTLGSCSELCAESGFAEEPTSQGCCEAHGDAVYEALTKVPMVGPCYWSAITVLVFPSAGLCGLQRFQC